MSLPEAFSSLRLPVVAAPMFLVSTPDLVVSSCTSGVVGTFPALNERTTEGFAEWVDEIQGRLDAHNAAHPDTPAAPYGVNLIAHRSNPRLKADLEVCVEKEVPLIITSLGAAKDIVDAVHSYGGIVFHDVTNRYHAKKAIEAGVDGIILVCGGAGGHAGNLNPFALINDIRPHYDGTILLAGSINTGSDVLAAQAMGADLAYMGTRFIATEESGAQPEYKQMLVDVGPEDILYTPAISGIPANFMKTSLLQNGYDLEQLDKIDVDVSNIGEKLTSDEEARAWKTVWSAGHGVSGIRDTPSTAALIDRLEEEHRAARKRLALD